MNQTILVVDDKLGVREMLQDYISAQGFRVMTAPVMLLTAKLEESDKVQGGTRRRRLCDQALTVKVRDREV